MDLMLLFPGFSYLASYANSNLVQPIDEEVEQWGADIVTALGEQLEAGQYEGIQYMIPQNKDVRRNAYGFNLSLELCEKYDINPDDVKTLEDLEAAFETIKTSEPTVTVLMPEMTGTNIATVLDAYYDNCGTGGGVSAFLWRTVFDKIEIKTGV